MLLIRPMKGITNRNIWWYLSKPEHALRDQSVLLMGNKRQRAKTQCVRHLHSSRNARSCCSDYSVCEIPHHLHNQPPTQDTHVERQRACRTARYGTPWGGSLHHRRIGNPSSSSRDPRNTHEWSVVLPCCYQKKR